MGDRRLMIGMAAVEKHERFRYLAQAWTRNIPCRLCEAFAGRVGDTKPFEGERHGRLADSKSESFGIQDTGFGG